MTQKTKQTKVPHLQEDFKGYTLNELRYQRALIALKREYCKESLMVSAKEAHKMLPFNSSGNRAASKHMTGLAGKIVGGLNYVDYAMLGFSVFGAVRKVFRLFHRKK